MSDDYPQFVLAEAYRIENERLRQIIRIALDAISEGYDTSASIVLRMALDPTTEVTG